MHWFCEKAVSVVRLASQQTSSLWRWLVQILSRASNWTQHATSRQISSLWRWLVQVLSRASKRTHHAAWMVSSKWEDCTNLIMPMVPEACKSQARSLRRLLVVKILVRFGKRIQLAARVFVWVVAGVFYLSLLVFPPVLSVEIDTLAFVAYHVAYSLIYIAQLSYRLSLHLAGTARHVRNIRTIDGYFEY
jgi:hypothetical protein